MTYNELVANKIRQTRIEAGISAEAVSHYLGKDKATYSLLENGKIQINVEHLKSIGEFFKKPSNHFLPEISPMTQISYGEGHIISFSTNTFHNSDPKVIEGLKLAIETLQQIIDRS